MEDQRHDRLIILMKQERNEEALKLIQELLSDDPHDVVALVQRAGIEADKEQFEKALETSDEIIGIAPEWAYPYTLKARILISLKNLKLAEIFLKQSIAIDPEDSNTWNVYAWLKHDNYKFQDALEMIDRSLELEPDDTDSLNLRSMILMKLKKKDEAFKTIEGSLNENPNNEFTHATYGWTLLEAGDHKKSLEHFRESLRINPNFEYAQNGMAQALKARYAVFRWFLQYSFWLGKLPKQSRIIFIIGFVIVMRTLRTLSRTNEDLQPLIIPIIVIGALFGFSTWVIDPLSNLFLRLNPYGRHLLSKKETLSSTFVGISFSLFILGIIAFLFTYSLPVLSLAIFGLTMTIPSSAMFADSKNRLVYYTAVMAVLGTMAIAINFMENTLLNGVSTVYLILFILFQFVANFFVLKEE